MGWVKNEQQALITTLRASDPKAPTLDEGWDVRRLLAHLVAREQMPLAMVKDAAARKPPGQEPSLTELVKGTEAPGGFEALIDRFAAGAPKWSPMSWAAEKINLAEYTIHHEDIRRGGDQPAEPRNVPLGQQNAIWGQLALLARSGLSAAPGGVHLATPDGRHRVVKKGAGVTVTGDPVELALYVSGRRSAAKVDITGPDHLVTQFERAMAKSD